MSGKTALSIIIPTFNRSGYVRDCLIALRESGVPDLEIIVADDGSTDDTAAVVAATNPAAKYIWQPNSGTPATARNKGFSISTGRYVAFLDCDDAWLPYVPAKSIALLNKYPEVDVLFADAKMGNPQEGYVSWIETGGQAEFAALPDRKPEPGFRILERGPLFRRMAVRNPVFIGAVIVRREAFEQVGMFEPTLCGAADWELWLRMAHRYTFGFQSEALAIYTRHLDNMSSNHDKMIAEFCQSLRNVLVKCDLSPEDRTFITQRLQHHLFSHAYLAYEAGRFTEARQRFGLAWQAGDHRPKTAALYAACTLPSGVVRRLRSWKQSTTV